MKYYLGFTKSVQNNNEYLEQKFINIGQDTYFYWVIKKQDDPNYELINSNVDTILVSDNENLKQAYMNSQKALFQANKQMESMKQMIMKLQKQLFNQQQNTGGTTDVSK